MQEVNNKVNKSSFDLSFQNNLTMQFGYLYPCFVKKFAPNTKVKIKPTFGLNFMPMMFPVQTRMRARMSFYKVRCRSVWKDYKDWFGNLKPNLVKPYINFDTDLKLKKMASTGSLGDYLGLPTTFPNVDYGNKIDIPTPSAASDVYLSLPNETYPTVTTSQPYETFLSWISSGTLSVVRSAMSSPTVQTKINYNFFILPSAGDSRKVTIDYTFGLQFSSPSDVVSTLKAYAAYVTTIGYVTGENELTGVSAITNSPDVITLVDDNKVRVYFQFEVSDKYANYPIALGVPSCVASTGDLSYIGSGVGRRIAYDFDAGNGWAVPVLAYPLRGRVGEDSLAIPYFSWNSYRESKGERPTVSDITLETSPYYNSESANKEKQLMIDASFFRAYEAIYNAYFRDIRNNPFMLNGQPEYNVFIPSDAGGEDNNVYELRRRNWEADFLTTAVPSPQQGRAPLVGITTYNDTTKMAFTAEDGKKYMVDFDYNTEKEELENVSFQQLADDAVIKEPRNVMDLVASGISISDLRNVNAYTKFLELNMRKGYFYKDLVEGHFDTHVRYDELNMPEFIGGTSKDIFVNPVSQTVQTSQDGSYFGALGSYAGQASVQGTADNTISAFFDEECIVIGLISIVPVANYSQLLPKHFLHRDLLDSYFPEFDNIGFQPIMYNEVCPIQAYNDDPDSLDTLFGYQRPWYDYVASVDEVHGLFRNQLRNFLINRVFEQKPTLSPDFLLVDPKQVNDVFSVTQVTDKILGQIWFDVVVNAPISRIAIPRLD